MHPRSASGVTLAVGLLGLTVALVGCSERRGAVIEDRLASAIPLAPQAVLLLDSDSAAPLSSEPLSVMAPVLLDEPGLVTTWLQVLAPLMSKALACEMMRAL